MAPWCFHVLYPPFDVDNIMGYPNDVPPNWRDKIPKFDGDYNFSTWHVTSFLEFISWLNVTHENVLMMLMFGKYQVDIKFSRVVILI
jgi:hypothetical protein